MSYNTIAQCATDDALLQRVRAAVSTQPDAPAPPDAYAYQIIWPLSGASDVEAAYASALAADNPNPGGDDGVVTDQMILTGVQAHWPASAP